MGRRALFAAVLVAPGVAHALWWDGFALFQVRTPDGAIVVGLTRAALDALGPGTELERLDRALASADGLAAWDYGPWPGRKRRYAPRGRITLRRGDVLRFDTYVPARPVDLPPG